MRRTERTGARRVAAPLVLLIVCASASAGGGWGSLGLGDAFIEAQWGLEAVRAPDAWQITTGDRDVVVAVVDSGVDLTHLDLRGNLWDGNALHGASVARPWGVFEHLPVGAQTTTLDETGHGTQVIGVVAAEADNGIGVRGVAQVSVMVVKVYGLGAPGHVEALADGIRWAAANGARVISVSISASNHPALRPAVMDAWCAGAVIVASAGNLGNPTMQYPAGYPEVLGVGAIDVELSVWPDSNRGVDVYAPGVDILTTAQGNQYASATGTSFSAPFVAGAAALVLAANPALTNADVAEILKATARDLPGADAPLLDVAAAVERALETQPSVVPVC